MWAVNDASGSATAAVSTARPVYQQAARPAAHERPRRRVASRAAAYASAPSSSSGAPPSAAVEDGPAAKIGEQKKRPDRAEETEGVKKAVRDEPGGRCRSIVEMVPVQQLVKDRLVDEGGDTDTEKRTGRDIAPGAFLQGW